MMILVTGRAQVPAEHRERFIEVAGTMCRASRDDDGCLGYRVYEDLEQPGHHVFVEEWRDDQALQAHFATPHTAAFMAALPGLLGGAPEVLFHAVGQTRRLDPGKGLVDV
jgi:quinol monooxygenase YgiN